MEPKQTSKIEDHADNGETTYNQEFKEKVIEICNSGTYSSIADCARAYQVPKKLLYYWLSQSKKQSIVQNPELASLRKENAKLKMELEILKKATVYFAKQMK